MIHQDKPLMRHYSPSGSAKGSGANVAGMYAAAGARHYSNPDVTALFAPGYEPYSGYTSANASTGFPLASYGMTSVSEEQHNHSESPHITAAPVFSARGAGAGSLFGGFWGNLFRNLRNRWQRFQQQRGGPCGPGGCPPPRGPRRDETEGGQDGPCGPGGCRARRPGRRFRPCRRPPGDCGPDGCSPGRSRRNNRPDGDPGGDCGPGGCSPRSSRGRRRFRPSPPEGSNPGLPEDSGRTNPGRRPDAPPGGGGGQRSNRSKDYPRSLTQADQKKFLDALNAYRRRHGLKPVKLSKSLCNAAQKHSDYQTKLSGCSHYGPKTHRDRFIRDNDPWWFTGRAQLAGYDGKAVSENVAAGQTADPWEVIKDWDQSPGHKKTMLDPNITEIGIGYNGGGKGPWGWTGGGRWTLMTGRGASKDDLVA